MSSWTFLTNHAQVLLAISVDNRATAKEIAAVVGVTERAVQRIIDDLETAGCISRSREGRKNRYEIHAAHGLRHPAQHGCTIRDLLLALTVAKD